MTWPQIRTILEDEFSCDTEPIDSIDLLGGEPLLNFDVIPLIEEWVRHHSPQTKIVIRTNGTILTEDMKRWFIDHKDSIMLGLSLDGTPEVNRINRGKGAEDLKFFISNWPENPVKVTIFPDSVGGLYESVMYLYSMGAKVTASLAQGVEWDKNSCERLESELSKLTDYYITEHLSPVEPLYDLNFDKGFWIPEEKILEEPCWEQANIHSYDCDGERLPCHMYSVIVQGKNKRKKILIDAESVDSEQLPAECTVCPIRWCCKNCMAMNYQHTGDFGNNINLKYMCAAQKVAAGASADYLVRLFEREGTIPSGHSAEAIGNAIMYLKRNYNER